MRSDTSTVGIAAPPAAVHAFLADPEHLPRWAIGFAKAVRREPAGWVVTTAQGDVPVAVEADEAAGTVDFHMRPAPGVEAVAYVRVVPNGDGSEVVFTQFQQPGTPDEVFDQLVAAVGHELVALRALMEVECPL